MLSDDDRNLIFKLAADLIGSTNSGELRHESIVTNVQRRMEESGYNTLTAYLEFVDENPVERAQLVSALSIHTTSWFRENPHFVAFQEFLLEALKNREVFKIWCAACSTGEEVYSFALMLEEFRSVHPSFEYEVLGSDIDPISIEAAGRAIYAKKSINFHLNRYKHHLLMGSGPTEDFFTLTKEIRSRCKFRVADLRQVDARVGGPFHVIVCRNVLIYFDQKTVRDVVQSFVPYLREGGRLLLGHSETIGYDEGQNGPRALGLVQKGHSVFIRDTAKTKAESKATAKKQVRPERRPDLVVIGASTGGPQALMKALKNMPKDSPPIVITQHIAPAFAKPLAERLALESSLTLGRAEDGIPLDPGHIYMSFGDYHLAVAHIGRRLLLKTLDEPPMNGHRPSVDVLFDSVRTLKVPAMALLLTGMGSDGARGIKDLHRQGVFCVAQSEEDCVVYGMPREAVDRGAVHFVGNLDEIRHLLVTSFQLAGRPAA